MVILPKRTRHGRCVIVSVCSAIALFTFAAGALWAEDTSHADSAQDSASRWHTGEPASDSEGHAEGSDHDSAQGRQLKRQFRGYGRFRNTIARLCAELEADYRAERLFQILDAHSENDPECVACRPLFRSIAMACEPKRKRVIAPKKTKLPDAEEELSPAQPPAHEPAASSTFPRREPHTYVLHYASLLGVALYDDAELRDETSLALLKLKTFVGESTASTPGESDYYEILLAYFLAPFERAWLRAEHVSRSPRVQEHEVSTQEKQQILDELF